MSEAAALEEMMPQHVLTGLSVDGLSVFYRRRRPILDDISFTAPRGELTALIGANGCGKSTLIHTILDLVPASAGSVLFDGIPMADEQSWNTGFCGDDLPLPELLTGAEYFHVMTRLRGAWVPAIAVTDLFAALNMAGAESRVIREYSHGMKRKLQLLANVVHQPDLLILDEPFRGLDPESHGLMQRLLDSYARQGRCVLLSTHDLDLARRLCHRFVVISSGGVNLVDTAHDAADGRALVQTGPDSLGDGESADWPERRVNRFFELLREVSAT
ncbi:MAG: yxlF [Frondihabitans sp.]|nr:yxlF [Frondihabitans sp.]